MKVECIAVGDLECNCYLLEKDQECLLVDPGDDYSKILDFIQGKNVIGILVTHQHFDHVASLERLVAKFGYPIFSASNLKPGVKRIGSFCFEVIPTLGHTMDSLSFYFREEKKMFTGDFLFYDTIGRCDFLESNYQEMLKSIEVIKKFDDDVLVYPGHGRMTTLGREKKYNIYFQ